MKILFRRRYFSSVWNDQKPGGYRNHRRCLFEPRQVV